MKKRVSLILCLFILLFITGCSTSSSLDSQIIQIEEQIQELEESIYNVFTDDPLTEATILSTQENLAEFQSTLSEIEDSLTELERAIEDTATQSELESYKARAEEIRSTVERLTLAADNYGLYLDYILTWQEIDRINVAQIVNFDKFNDALWEDEYDIITTTIQAIKEDQELLLELIREAQTLGLESDSYYLELQELYLRYIEQWVLYAYYTVPETRDLGKRTDAYDEGEVIYAEYLEVLVEWNKYDGDHYDWYEENVEDLLSEESPSGAPPAELEEYLRGKNG